MEKLTIAEGFIFTDRIREAIMENRVYDSIPKILPCVIVIFEGAQLYLPN